MSLIATSDAIHSLSRTGFQSNMALLSLSLNSKIHACLHRMVSGHKTEEKRDARSRFDWVFVLCPAPKEGEIAEAFAKMTDAQLPFFIQGQGTLYPKTPDSGFPDMAFFRVGTSRQMWMLMLDKRQNVHITFESDLCKIADSYPILIDGAGINEGMFTASITVHAAE